VEESHAARDRLLVADGDVLAPQQLEVFD